jgi:hypothetical protein
LEGVREGIAPLEEFVLSSVFIRRLNLFNNPAVVQTVTTENAAPGARKRRWKRLACYLPLAALAAELVWIFLMFIALIFAVGDTPYVNTPDKSRFFSWLSSVPAAAGALFGVVGIGLRLPVKIVDWIFLIAGAAACAGLFCLCTSGLW